jgi:hypothetical protein
LRFPLDYLNQVEWLFHNSQPLPCFKRPGVDLTKLFVAMN